MSRKQSKQTLPSNQRTGRIPTFEQVLNHLADALEYTPRDRAPHRLQKEQKYKFNFIEQRPQRLNLEGYQETARRVLGKLVPRLGPSARNGLELLKTELEDFLGRYEHLGYQIRTGNATPQQAVWSLATRFFVPWLALRIAFLSRKQADSLCREDKWFIPLRKGRLSSAFMHFVETYVQNPGESTRGFCRRRADLAGQEGNDEPAERLSAKLRSLRRLDEFPSDRFIDAIVKPTRAPEGLRLKLIVARAIDRSVSRAKACFGNEAVLDLVNWFAVSLEHLEEKFRSLRAEMPEDDTAAWMLLHSMTIMASTPFEEDRYFVLIDQFMAQVARKVSEELEHADSAGGLAPAPRRLERCTWAISDNPVAPAPILKAEQAGDFLEAVRASQAHFSDKTAPSEAEHTARHFYHRGRLAYCPDWVGNPFAPPEEAAGQLVTEAIRLYQIAYQRSNGERKFLIGRNFLDLLLDPERPKSSTDRELAAKLLAELDAYYRSAGRGGSAAYLRGAFEWAAGEPRKAMKSFREAERLGKESCGEDWIYLIRRATVLAERGFPRQRKRFMKLAKLFGLFSNDQPVRTRLLMNEMRYEKYKTDLEATFKGFPT